MSYFLFVPLRPFFSAALAKRWKVQFRKGLHKFNNVDSKTTYFHENCCIIYIYIYIDTKTVNGVKSAKLLLQTPLLLPLDKNTQTF